MRYTQYLLPTLRETPGDAEVISHQLMLRAGMIRKLAAGIYDYLPLGLRSIRKVENIVREEMNRAGAIELLMPMVLPAELWQETGRWEQYGKELLRFKDRKETDFCLGPTHEEVITDMVRGEVSSYRQMPINLYQIQTKFRDEIRPRFGLMRGREFIMKDAYCFDVDRRGCACRLRQDVPGLHAHLRSAAASSSVPSRPTPASSAATFSHEFMVLGRDGRECHRLLRAAAGMRPTSRRPSPRRRRSPSCDEAQPLEQVATPGVQTIEASPKLPTTSPAPATIKTLVLHRRQRRPVLVLLRGDHQLNEIKLTDVLGCAELRAGRPTRRSWPTGALRGSLGAGGRHEDPVYADRTSARRCRDDHRRQRGRLPPAQRRDRAGHSGRALGRPAPGAGGRALPALCRQPLKIRRAIEVGHVFKLGTKYSAGDARHVPR